ncbi:putative integral membrane protein [Kocuria rhizophila]
MATTTSSRAPWLVVLGVLLAVAAAALITFTDLAWRGLIGWPLMVVALLLVVTGGIRRGQRRRDTHRA